MHLSVTLVRMCVFGILEEVKNCYYLLNLESIERSHRDVWVKIKIWK